MFYMEDNMKKVSIKYNPYKLETEITVDGKHLAQNSVLLEKSADGSRLQEWVEELPQLLVQECNDTLFDVKFRGTLHDYNDVVDAFTLAYNSGEIKKVYLDRIPAKETTDKEKLIDQVFEKIKKGPFDELRGKDVTSAFERAKSSDFEVCVVATMSAGKSTLINALLREKLMPSKQEACTAIITKIKDTNTTDWKAKVYAKDGKLIEQQEHLTYSIMERLNGDEHVSEIEVSGNIPFVNSDDMSLVLVDTPGPNNARDPEHKKVQSEFLSKSSKPLILYIMEGTFGSDSDNELLGRVAESMKVGGKQSKDRFIFVVNKMDGRRAEDGTTDDTLKRVRAYLENHGIYNPNIFPAASLPALNIQLIKNGVKVDEDTQDETYMLERKLNRNDDMHFEQYASLPKSIKDDINKKLETAKKKEDTRNQALIHTGIPSIEASIQQYVQKYAKTAKIKNIVDTFSHKLDEVGCVEKTKQELAKNVKQSEKIVQTINRIRSSVDDIKSARNFQRSVDAAVAKVNESNEIIETIVAKLQAKITQKIDQGRGEKLDVDDVKYEIDSLEKFAKSLEPDFQVDLENMIQNTLKKTCDELLREYRNKLAALTEVANTSGLDISIDPLKLMEGSVSSADSFSYDYLVETRKVQNGTEKVKNENWRWYNPFTWKEGRKKIVATYKTVREIEASQLAQEFLEPVQSAIYENGDRARKYASEQANKIKAKYNLKFKELDAVLKKKLDELESYATDQKKAEKRVQETKRKLQWLDDIQKDVKSILEI